MSEHHNVLVIGAGMGGVCAAARLAAAGKQPLLVERAGVVGGRASSFEKDGYVINTGAVAIEIDGALGRTLDEVGIEIDLRFPDPANVFRVGGRTVNPGRGGWSFLLDRITRHGAKVLTRLGEARKGDYPDTELTLEDWVSSATSNQTVHRLFRNLAAAIFAVNAGEIPAKAFLTYFMEKGAFRRFGFHPDGTVAVTRALADVVMRQGGPLWLESEVVSLNTSGPRVTGATVRRGGESLEISCDAVISDIGPVATLSLLGEEALDADYVAAIHRRSRPSANIVIHVASDQPLLDTPGLIVFSSTDRLCNAGNLTATCPELAPEGKHLLVAYAVPRPAIGEFDSERELSRAIDELRRELPGMARAEIIDARVMRGDMPAQRAAAGYELPWRTPLENLWNVGDGVRPYASGGLQACAETAEQVVSVLT